MGNIILAVLSSTVLVTILNRIFALRDRKKDKSDAILESIEEVKTELREHKKEDKKYKADICRTRILRFSDELRRDVKYNEEEPMRDVKHSEEAFNNVLEDIDYYLDYCANNDAYVNSKADAAIRNIKEIHDRCIRGELEFL